ncbi:MAG: DUF167 domain-containing protein [Bacteroidota bacterium]|jgi:uncharacterized protein (TIGR00251 family)|nr:DUF167 domain-containing protein [Cytophagales bacterium]MCE2956124.1 DUF167 domain-containing protein [Flammeovirgaceae bacterium]MCZ8071140.1 DUF167 domain-containing protein [Cytophagales bacterium]
MKGINIKVIPNARKNVVVEEGGILKVYVNAPANDGKANAAVIQTLALHFGIKKNQVRIVRGMKSRTKIVEIDILQGYFG